MLYLLRAKISRRNTGVSREIGNLIYPFISPVLNKYFISESFLFSSDDRY